MTRVKFTRDEVILALDVFYSSGKNRASNNSNEMRELSSLLNRLPIHPKEKRPELFRTQSGIAQQLNLFLQSCAKGKKDVNVGKLFFDVAFEYEEQRDKLHLVAEAIRRNEPFYGILFGDELDSNGFSEGGLLGHLHRCIEKRAERKWQHRDCCMICGIDPKQIYATDADILELHLLVPPEQLDGSKEYEEEDYITVCPNCHTMLHRTRPWRQDFVDADIIR